MDPLDRIEALLAGQRLAALSTVQDGAPYTSLVAFAPGGVDDIFFATARYTRKWRNLSQESRVSLLIDDRSNRASDFHEAAAATAIGTTHECEDDEAAEGRLLLEARHPHLADFLAAPSTAVCRVAVSHYYLVSRFQAVTRVEVGGKP